MTQLGSVRSDEGVKVVVDPSADGAVYDGVTDGLAAINAAIARIVAASIGGERPSGTVSIAGPLSISNTIQLPVGASIIFEGTGSGYGEPTAGAGALIWNGPAGVPMIDATATIGSGLLRVRCVGNDTNEPSAVWHQTDTLQAEGDAQSNFIEKCQLGADRNRVGRIQRGLHVTGSTGADRWVMRDCEIIEPTVAGIDNDNPQATWSTIENVAVLGRGLTGAFSTPAALITKASITASNFNVNRCETVLSVPTGSPNVQINFLGAEHFNKLIDVPGGNTNIRISGGYAQMTDVPASSNFVEYTAMGESGSLDIDNLEFRGPWPTPRAKLHFDATRSGNQIRIVNCEGVEGGDLSLTVASDAGTPLATPKRIIVEGTSSTYDVTTNTPDTQGPLWRNILHAGDTAVDPDRFDAIKLGLEDGAVMHTIDVVAGQLRLDGAPLNPTVVHYGHNSGAVATFVAGDRVLFTELNAAANTAGNVSLNGATDTIQLAADTGKYEVIVFADTEAPNGGDAVTCAVLVDTVPFSFFDVNETANQVGSWCDIINTAGAAKTVEVNRQSVTGTGRLNVKAKIVALG